jgi:hypothetical protein
MKMIELNPHHLHSLEVVIHMTGSSRRKIIFYCRKGVIQPAHSEERENGALMRKPFSDCVISKLCGNNTE